MLCDSNKFFQLPVSSSQTMFDFLLMLFYVCFLILCTSMHYTTVSHLQLLYISESKAGTRLHRQRIHGAHFQKCLFIIKIKKIFPVERDRHEKVPQKPSNVSGAHTHERSVAASLFTSRLVDSYKFLFSRFIAFGFIWCIFEPYVYQMRIRFYTFSSVLI